MTRDNDTERLNVLLRQAVTGSALAVERGLEAERFFYNEAWAPDKLAVLRDRGQLPTQINEYAATINMTIGQMLGRPLDWKPRPVGLDDDAKAEAAEAALKYVATQNDSRNVFRDVYKDGLTGGGYGCVLTGPYVRDDDPRSEIVQFVHVPWSQVLIDPMSRRLDLADARYVIWRRPIARELAEELFAEDADDMTPAPPGGVAASGFTFINNAWVPDGSVPAPSERASVDALKGLSLEAVTDGEPTVWLNEIWEVQDRRAWWVRRKSGIVELVPADTQIEAMAWVDADGRDLTDVLSRQVSEDPIQDFWRGRANKVVRTAWSGDVLLESETIPQTHQQIPWAIYIYDRDHHGQPFPMGERLKDPQAEINMRHSKAVFEMNNRPIRIGGNVMMRNNWTPADIAEMEAGGSPVYPADPGEVEYLNPGGAQMGRENMAALERMSTTLQKISGMNDHLMGYGGNEDASGKAKEIAISQAEVGRRDGEERLLAFHRRLGELLLSDVQQFHRDPWFIRVTDDVGLARALVLNGDPTVDPLTGQETPAPTIYDTRFDLMVDSQPWTPTMRGKAFDSLLDLARGEADPLMALKLKKLAIKASDMPNRQDVLDIYDEMLKRVEAPAPVAPELAQQAAAVDPNAPSPLAM